MFTINVHTQFYMPPSNASLVAAIIPKTTEKFRTAGRPVLITRP